MGTTLALRFPLGSFHATPWDRAANESVPEWPPAPWRLLRAIYATWKWRLPDLAEVDVLEILGVLCRPPSYSLPRHAEAHTRHYFPDTGYGTDKVFDPYIVLDPNAVVAMRWDDDLSAASMVTLERLCARVGYLGRAESLCEISLVKEGELPGRYWVEPGPAASLGSASTRVLCPVEPLQIESLLVTTGQARRSGRLIPLGSRLVDYVVSPPEGAPARRHRRRTVSLDGPEVALFALDAPVRPSTLDTVWVADVMRRAALRSHGDPSSVLAGKDAAGTPLLGHTHAHYLPLDVDGDGLLDSLAVWAPGGLDASALDALSAIRRLWSNVPGFRPVRLRLTATGDASHVLPSLSTPNGASTWKSVTPFAPYRHRKRHTTEQEFVAAEVQRELATRVLPTAEVDTMAASSRGWLEYRRQRPGRSRDVDALGLRLHFPTPVRGPLVLGALCHFGLGLFRPDDGR